METSNLPHTEFKTLVTRMPMNLGEEYMHSVRISQRARNHKKEIETIRKQPKIKNTITEMKKNTLEEISNKLDKAEHQISDLKDKIVENTQSE